MNGTLDLPAHELIHFLYSIRHETRRRLLHLDRSARHRFVASIGRQRNQNAECLSVMLHETRGDVRAICILHLKKYTSQTIATDSLFYFLYVTSQPERARFVTILLKVKIYK